MNELYFLIALIILCIWIVIRESGYNIWYEINFFANQIMIWTKKNKK